ncbi:MAG: hypothetical protein EOO52_20350 [Gammaproteobacteria bacterium]|nr:MAG: hypothetical protein EOO52_20350 [Gammaproteobacteria bacterium]
MCSLRCRPPDGTTTPTATGVSHPYTLTSLTANTTYYVWVRGNCGSGNGVSVWSVVKSFTTPCDALNVPYTVNFNTVTTPAIPNCTSVENVNADAYTWETATAPTGYTGNVLRIHWNSAMAMNDWFYTAGLNLTAGKSYVISYKYRPCHLLVFITLASRVILTLTSFTSTWMISP